MYKSWKKILIIHWRRLMIKNWIKRGEEPCAWFSIMHGQKNPKNVNHEELCLFEYTVTERITWLSAKCCQGQWFNIKYWRTWQVASKYRRQNAVPSVDISGGPSYVPSYVPSVNTYRAPSEQQIGALQEERWTTHEQVKALENIIAPVEIKVYEAAHLWELVVFACWRLM